VLVLLSVLLAGMAAPAANWCQCFANDNILFGYVSVKAVRAIPEFGALLDGQDKLSRMADAGRQHLAVDLETVTDVWFGISPTGGGISVLQGTYNLASVRGVVSANPNLAIGTPQGAEFTVVDPRAQKPTMVAFVDPRTAVLGQPAQVEAFLANLVSGTQHAQAKDLAGLEKPTRPLECVLLEVPRQQWKLPPVIADNIALLRLSAEATDAAQFQLTVVPKDPEMAAPLSTWCQSSLDLIRLLPPEQLAAVPEIVRVLLKGAVAAPAPGGVTLSAKLPMAMVARPVGRRMGTGGPAVPRPQ